MTRRPWTDAELWLLRARYADTPTPVLADMVGHPTLSVYRKAHQLGLAKSAEYMTREHGTRLLEYGRASRFPKGHVPWSKGTKGLVGFHPASRATQFKPGRPACEAKNYLPIGSCRISKDGYLERKVTDDPSFVPARRWVAVHRLLWIERHGAIPAGHVVVFKDGRRTNVLEEITIDRLELITRRELVNRNSIHRHGPEIAKLSQLKGAITRQINKRARQEAA